MPMTHQETNPSPLDRRITEAAGRLRDQGLSPDRDLWPGIDAALDRLERPRGRRGPRLPEAWRLTSLAACLALVLGLGSVGRQAPQVQDGYSDLRRLDDTLQELNEALQQDPDNQGLARLVLLVHKSRADVLRGGWEY